jgi:hypothetical protein
MKKTKKIKGVKRESTYKNLPTGKDSETLAYRMAKRTVIR